VPGQLATELQPRDGRRGLALSASKELEPGTRAMLLLAEGLFRLDVCVRGDSLQTFVRNLTSWPLDFTGDVSEYAPGRADLGFTLGAGDDLLMTKVTIATLQFAARGIVKVSALGIVRQAQAAAP
jgi:hypothetical protein